ncbi:ACT domain-containing protein ACR2 [Cucumis melo var. makuwa]|uniref:ACT domain-containing protein ACR n=1 Tax=Cucumis melo var. makuwa TaxID=1194695 RepID=A0A5D3C919_CUCMM|nr:ACT domain-containing protein ACR2 [Cucumis melo var. makuwa]TYK07830.1 ACT domain-containing protein ACR2 [Cucumis melo var. makuwa]
MQRTEREQVEMKRGARVALTATVKADDVLTVSGYFVCRLHFLLLCLYHDLLLRAFFGAISIVWHLHLNMKNVCWSYFNPDFDTLLERINGPMVCIDNESMEDYTIVKVDSLNKQSLLLEVVQILTDLDLSISKSYISCDTGWFMDVYRSSGTSPKVQSGESFNLVLCWQGTKKIIWNGENHGESLAIVLGWLLLRHVVGMSWNCFRILITNAGGILEVTMDKTGVSPRTQSLKLPVLHLNRKTTRLALTFHFFL